MAKSPNVHQITISRPIFTLFTILNDPNPHFTPILSSWWRFLPFFAGFVSFFAFFPHFCHFLPFFLLSANFLSFLSSTTCKNASDHVFSSFLPICLRDFSHFSRFSTILPYFFHFYAREHIILIRDLTWLDSETRGHLLPSGQNWSKSDQNWPIYRHFQIQAIWLA